MTSTMTQAVTAAPDALTRSAVICDDRPNVREALGAQLAAAGDPVQVTHVVPNGPELLGILDAASADDADGGTRPSSFVLIGVHRASGTGIDAIRLVRSRYGSLTLIAFGAAADAAVLADAVHAGASGALLWDPFRRAPADAASTVPLPVRWITGGLPRQPLTERENHVLREISKGQSNGEIGQQLQLSQDSVKNTAHRLFSKLGARDRAHAVAIALRSGLLT